MGSFAYDSLWRECFTLFFVLCCLQHRNGRLGGSTSAKKIVTTVLITMCDKFCLKLCVKLFLPFQEVNHVLLLSHAKVLKWVLIGAKLGDLLIRHSKFFECSHFLFRQLFEVVFDHAFVVRFGQLNHILVERLEILFWEE